MGIKEKLKELGFYRPLENISQILSSVKALHENWERDSSGLLPSYLLCPPDSPAVTSGILAIDVGGSYTKAALCGAGDKGPEWKFLFEKNNFDFQSTSQGGRPAFESFAEALATAVKSSLLESGIPTAEVKNVGVVWSNPLENSLAAGSIRAISATSYFKKGEWFTHGLRKGTDLSLSFVSAFQKEKISVERFIVANDTPLTLLSGGGDSGVVASTGVNATVVWEGIICNAEMGSAIKLEKDLVSRADYVTASQQAGFIELLIGGNFIPRIFCSHIIALADMGVEVFKPVASHLLSIGEERWHKFDARDLFSLLDDKESFIELHPAHELEIAIEALACLSREVLLRAAKLLGVVIYASLFNQLPGKNSLKVSLDSWLARRSPLFLETLNESVRSVLPSDKTAALDLQQPLELPAGAISVPMRGIARAFC